MATVQKRPLNVGIPGNHQTKSSHYLPPGRVSPTNRSVTQNSSITQLSNDSLNSTKNSIHTSTSRNNITNPASRPNSTASGLFTTHKIARGNKTPSKTKIGLSNQLAPNMSPSPIKNPISREGLKMKGMWEQYSERWFDIQCKNLVPLFMEIPLPKKKLTLENLDTKQDKETGSTQTKEFRHTYKCSYWKYKEMYNDKLETCEGCKAKKKKTIHLECSHFVCRECLCSHIKKQVEMEKIPVMCLKKGCNHALDKLEINKYAPNTEIVKKYYDLSVTKYVEKHPNQLVQCYTPGCGYVVDLSKMKQKEILHCSRCKTSYCLRCHKPMHAGMNCEDN